MAERGHPRPVGDGEQDFTFRNVQLLKNETLGTGSYGAVCKAKCDQLICAAKLLYPVLFQFQAPDPGREHRQPFQRFEQECRFLSRITHPNIVQYLGTYHDPETNAPVLLMELMDESLTHFLESSPGDIPYHIQVKLSQDMAQALAFLHANGIIHRDLSSNNVLLIAGSRAKVSDFGMSKFTKMNTRLATMTQCPGTPAYMSPEALNKPPVYTEKLDNFSFGVHLVQIITRQYPAPGDQFETEFIPSRRNPKRMVEAKIAIPEVERRQAHISLIEPTHPLLPIALECLKDEAVERPSSQQLCQSLDALKGTVKYEESLQQDVCRLFREKEEQFYEKDQQIRAKDRDLQALQYEVEEKEQQLRAKDEVIKIKDEVVLSKDQALQALQLDVEAKESQLKSLNQQLDLSEEVPSTVKLQYAITQRDREIAELKQANEHQLRRLNQQLESNDESTATLQQAIIQRDREIAELREILADKNGEEASIPHFEGSHSAQATPNSKEQLTMTWEILPAGPRPEYYISQSCVVGGDKVCVVSGGSIWQFTFPSQWNQLPDPPTYYDDFSLASIEDELTTVGGWYMRLSSYRTSNKLQSYIRGKWVIKYPPMPTKRYGCTAVYANHAFIVVGGSKQDFHGTSLASVEILNTISKQWSTVSSLPLPTHLPSVSICGECIYAILNASVVRCSLFSLAFSTPIPVIWEEIASLPVEGSTLVSVKGHLLAVGGRSTTEQAREIHQFNVDTNSWEVVSRMNIGHSGCSVALLPDNKLMVMGESSGEKSIELANIL